MECTELKYTALSPHTKLFYLFIQQFQIFEGNQNDLQSATEKLSELLGNDINDENLMDLKQKIMDQSVYCEARRQVLLDHVREGDEKELWTCV
jgi:ariadne-1